MKLINTASYLTFLLFFSLNLKAGDVEIKMKKYPVTQTFSLGDRGVLFYGEDPKNNSNQKEIVLVKDEVVVWYSQFMPSAYKVIPLYSNESNYMYFIEEGYIKGGDIGYVYIDNSGTSRKGKINMSLEMRKIGVSDMSKLELIKMHSAKDYFVILFSEKSATETVYYALSVAHSTQRVYPTKFIQTAYSAKDKFKSEFEFIGTADQLMFAQRAVEGDFKGFYITFLDPKEGKEEIRKFDFPIDLMAKHQKIYSNGVYDYYAKPISSSVTVKTEEYQGFVSYLDNSLIFSGVEFTDVPNALVLRKTDINGTVLFNKRHLLENEKDENPEFFGKLKNGNFGYQIGFYKSYFIGALSSKNTFSIYFDSKTGVVNYEGFSQITLDQFTSNIYYLFEDLASKKYGWTKICGNSFYYSSEPIVNQMEFKISQQKL